MSRDYIVVIEGEGASLSAWVPELPGCVAAGESRGEPLELIRGAIAMPAGSGEQPTSAPAEVTSVTVRRARPQA